MVFFESDIVQEEAKKLFTDYQELMKLGSDYGKFDREWKKMFIKKMIQKAVNRGLQVILLTCDPASYENFAEKRILLRPIIINYIY